MSLIAAQMGNASCLCSCHVTGIKTVHTCMPPRYCCDCNVFGLPLESYLKEKEQMKIVDKELLDRIEQLDKLYYQLNEQIRDIRELRYANHQQIGCVDARLNDISEEVSHLKVKSLSHSKCPACGYAQND